MSPGDTHDNLVCSDEFAPPAGRKYTVTVCERGLPVSRGKHHGVTTILEEWGHRVTQGDGTPGC